MARSARLPRPRRVRGPAGIPPGATRSGVSREKAEFVPLQAIVVLGCAVHLDSRGRLAPGPLERRIEAAARVFADRGSEHTIVVASGGRRWGRAVEADVMAVELALRGVPIQAIVRERSSLSTYDNARFAAGVLARRATRIAAVERSSLEWNTLTTKRPNLGARATARGRHVPLAVALVTCGWHMPRARALFSRAGVEVIPVPASPGPPAGAARRMWQWGREWVLTRLEGRGEGDSSCDPDRGP